MDDKKKIYILSAISFMDLFAIGLTMPLFSNHVRELGGSHFVAGLLSTTYSGIQLFSSPIVGSWSDLRGRKPVLIVTLLISSINYFLMGITSSLYFLFFVRLFLGFTKHTQTLCKTLISDTVSKDQQSTVFGFTTSVSMMGFIVGPIIGGHLSEYKNGFSYVCSITSILFIINIMLTYLLPLPKTTTESSTTSIKLHKEVIKVITDLKDVNWSAYWTLFITKFVHTLAISIYFYNYSIILRENFKLSQKTIGYTIAFQSCVGTISGFFTGKINKTFYKEDTSHSKKYFYGFAIMTFAFFLLCFSTNYVSFMLAVMPLAVSNSFLRIIETEILLAKSENDKGSLAGTSNSLTSLARLISPIFSGYISDILGENSVLYLSTILSGVGTFIAGYTRTNIKTKTS